MYYLIPPLQAIRTPVRFGSIAMMCVAILAAFGVAYILRNKRPKRVAMITLFLLGLIFLESVTIPWPTMYVGTRDDIPPVYHWLREQPHPSPIVELPLTYEFQSLFDNALSRGHTNSRLEEISPETSGTYGYEAPRMYYSTFHWQPIVNGYSSYFPKTYAESISYFTTFPSIESLDYGASIGIRYYVVHADEFPDWETVEATIAKTPRMRLVESFGDDLVYELIDSPS